jgi:hypothetical protein
MWRLQMLPAMQKLLQPLVLRKLQKLRPQTEQVVLTLQLLQPRQLVPAALMRLLLHTVELQRMHLLPSHQRHRIKHLQQRHHHHLHPVILL